jgi:hypothetical protein
MAGDNNLEAIGQYEVVQEWVEEEVGKRLC